MHDLERNFATKGIHRGGTLFLKASAALDFIEAARQATTLVLGIDTFIITETTTEPLPEHILDCSELPADTWSVARRFVEVRKGSGFMFEIVI